MSFYFVCPGDVTVSSNTVQCSTEISSVDASANEPYFSSEDRQNIIDGLMACMVTILVCWLIKKAIDL